MDKKVKITIKPILLAFCFALLPLSVSAAGLGKLNVFSALGEPLNAEIELLSTSQELLSLNAILASDDLYIAQGIDKTAIQRNIRVSVVKRPDGIPVLWLSSSQAVTDPFLDMLIQVSWNEGKLTREYTLLLDPPEQSDSYVESPVIDALEAPIPVEGTAPTAKSEKSNSTNKLVKSIQRTKLSKTIVATVDEKKITISKGDTLVSIAQRLQVQDVNLDQLLIGLYKANPAAFKNENINRLIVGKVIDIPNAEKFQEISKESAKSEVRAQVKSWNAYATKLVDEVSHSAADAGGSNHQNGGKIVTKAEENLMPETEGPHDVVKLAKTESSSRSKTAGDPHAQKQSTSNLEDDLVAKRNDIKESDEKATVLAKQIADMKKLLAVKSKSMADVQQAPSKKALSAPTKKAMLWILAAGVLIWLVFLARARRTRQLSEMHLGSISNEIAVNAENGLDGEKHSDNGKAELSEALEVSSDSEMPEVTKVDLSGISLDFDVAENASISTIASPAPIPEAFEGDLSGLLKVDIKSQAPKAPRKKRVAKVVSSDIDTKLELAVAYIDMADKKGALKLLKEVIRDGSPDQQQRAQSLIDGFA